MANCSLPRIRPALEMLAQLAEAAGTVDQQAPATSIVDGMLLGIQRAVGDIAALNDPNHTNALSNIETD